jgi:ligand-binding SRPBCC domain-containing protein
MTDSKIRRESLQSPASTGVMDLSSDLTVIQLETVITAPPQACFDMSRSIDVHMGSMANSGEKAVAGVTSGLIGPSEEVTWEARHFGGRFHMTTRITGYQVSRSFVDEQIDGPFASWWHQHIFEATTGGTLMLDRVRYSVPFGVLDRLADGLFLRRYMTRLLIQRNEYINAALEN